MTPRRALRLVIRCQMMHRLACDLTMRTAAAELAKAVLEAAHWRSMAEAFNRENDELRSELMRRRL